MLAVMLLLIAGGIGLAQAVSDPNQVTLRWLRLGGLIALSLIAVAGVALAYAPVIHRRGDVGVIYSFEAAIAAATFPALQLILVQRGVRTAQRLVAAVAALAIPFIAGSLLVQPNGRALLWVSLERWPVMLLAAGLSGGYLMTMLLGHAYLTAGGEMTQRPFMRLVCLLAGLLVLRGVASVLFGLRPWWLTEARPDAWIATMITARYGVGLVVPAVFTFMVWDCVRRRSNQSATGILYVATVLVMIGEGIALGLIGETGAMF